MAFVVVVVEDLDELRGPQARSILLLLFAMKTIEMDLEFVNLFEIFKFICDF